MTDGTTEQADITAQLAAARHNPLLLRAGAALVENDLPSAEAILRPYLKRRPADPVAIRLMAELAARVGRLRDSEHLLRRALELAPGFTAARANLATVIYRQHRWSEAIQVLDGIEQGDGSEESLRSLRAAALGRLGGYQEAISLYRHVLETRPQEAKVWMSLGHMLKTVGQTEDAIAAYRRAIAAAPTLGEVWWSLANLKTIAFSDEDVSTMRSALTSSGLSPDDRLHLHFALGKALEDRRADEDAFANYAEGNRIRARQMRYDPAVITRHVDACLKIFGREFLQERSGHGCSARDPIFILGMPRAGSTLLEQILASHSQVEGTAELPDIIGLVRALGPEGSSREELSEVYPAILADLPPERLRELGEEYLSRTRAQRTSDRPYFIDKMPNNWAHVGLIRLILPGARIIDARRHPVACGFSNFKQHFARGQGFTYSLESMGLYYRDYVRLMAHFDAVDPGAVYRVIHEQLVADPEPEVRRLLQWLELPFEDSCLRFYENRRAVRTASSEQVRRPISAAGLNQWQRFSPWLRPLEDALGPVIDCWDDAPPQ